MNYYWGKGIFCLFLTSLSCAQQSELFVQWIMIVYFLASSVCFFILSCIDRISDKEQAFKDAKLLELQKYQDGEDLWFSLKSKLPFGKNWLNEKISNVTEKIAKDAVKGALNNYGADKEQQSEQKHNIKSKDEKPVAEK